MLAIVLIIFVILFFVWFEIKAFKAAGSLIRDLVLWIRDKIAARKGKR